MPDRLNFVRRSSVSRLRFGVFVCVGASVGLLSSACTSSSPPPPNTAASMSVGSTPATNPPSTSAGTTQPTAPPSEEEAILAAYQGYWDTWLVANNPPNPNHPDLRKYATGNAYEHVVTQVGGHRDANIALKNPENSIQSHRASVISNDLQTATVKDCAVDDGITFNSLTGATIDSETYSYEFEATVVAEAETWQVSDVKTLHQWIGVSGCAAIP